MKGSGGQRERWKQNLEEAQDEYVGRTHSVCGSLLTPRRRV